ncbi:tRNA (adenosine(37)-N6)-threonylcarbamoyltransferase complex dimerization subunit type 1 TsaB [Ramlibacter rhizophilus]|uniref:tRNA (adenosine(37)-N6)-threonylcarbamoyltransferase complex dimerization subunit type 1 TsaB n=1 Tax=Ramlibacter rhizophilus TaxID=1781167 RepID=UPI001F10D150|nr:tRNA (adenosine(37)-N6)-threonylcarbamoyltransferase complex dimerization subunit type 1 TsaB [Ramlibacter rhizophilus]
MPQNLLAFDTSTESLSVALAWNDGSGRRLLAREAEGGRAASAALVPALMDLLRDASLPLARLDAIVFGQGPGSFTGLRTACAVAQGLAWGAGLPVLPVETLMAVAEDARERHGAERVAAVIDARMGEVYSADYEHAQGQWQRLGPIRLGPPEALVVPAGFVLAGNAFATLGERLPAGAERLPAAPTAAALLRLAPSLIARGGAVAPGEALPLYIRDKVAQTTQERLAARGETSPEFPAPPAVA